MIDQEYVIKYQLDETFRFNREEFVADFIVDFDKVFLPKVVNDTISYEDFQSIVSAERLRWMSIFKDTKISFDHADRFWGFFYATEVIPRRDRFVPRPRKKTGWPSDVEGSRQ